MHIKLVEGLISGCRELQDTLVLFRGQIVVEKVNGVQVLPSFDDLIMEVWAS